VFSKADSSQLRLTYNIKLKG